MFSIQYYSTCRSLSSHVIDHEMESEKQSKSVEVQVSDRKSIKVSLLLDFVNMHSNNK